MKKDLLPNDNPNQKNEQTEWDKRFDALVQNQLRMMRLYQATIFTALIACDEKKTDAEKHKQLSSLVDFCKEHFSDVDIDQELLNF